MASTPPPFSRFEWMIAWRYLRARRAEGGVSVMTWISLIGIALAVAALIITLAVRAGFRTEFVDTILGGNAHVTLKTLGDVDENDRFIRTIRDYDALADRIRALEGVTRVAPLVKGQVMVAHHDINSGAEVYGISMDDLRTIPRIAGGQEAWGDLERFNSGIAIGSVMARQLGVRLGDRIKLISPNGVKTPFGTSPRVSAYEVVYIFTLGRYQSDLTRIYMPFQEAQTYFNREGVADELEVMVGAPEQVELIAPRLMEAGGVDIVAYTWRDYFSGFLRALDIEDTVMFVLMSVLVLIAAMNIISGLVMLVKNKGRDIGILRTMGLTEGAVLRVFFLCGALVGLVGTLAGVVMGCLFAIYFDAILAFINGASGGTAWDASVRGIYRLPAVLRLQDVLSAIALSLGLSFVVTIFPARRAARMNPVEALRYE